MIMIITVLPMVVLVIMNRDETGVLSVIFDIMVESEVVEAEIGQEMLETLKGQHVFVAILSEKLFNVKTTVRERDIFLHTGSVVVRTFAVGAVVVTVRAVVVTVGAVVVIVGAVIVGIAIDASLDSRVRNLIDFQLKAIVVVGQRSRRLDH